MKKPRLHITDHAVIRYLGQVRGVDIDAIRAEIGRIVDLAEEHEGCSGVRADGFTYKIRGDSVTTVVASERADQRQGNRKRRRRG